MPKPVLESCEQSSAASSDEEGDEYQRTDACNGGDSISSSIHSSAPFSTATTASPSKENEFAKIPLKSHSLGAARAEIFSMLDKEMELADYATSEKTGCKVRRVSRKERAIRAAKRRALEREDDIRLGFRARDDDEDFTDNAGLIEENEMEDANYRYTRKNDEYRNENKKLGTETDDIEIAYENYNNGEGVANDDREIMEEVVALGADYLDLNDEDNDDEDEDEEEFDDNDEEIIEDDEDEDQDEEDEGGDSDDLDDSDNEDNILRLKYAKASTDLDTGTAKGDNMQRKNQPSASNKSSHEHSTESSTKTNEKKRKYTYRGRLTGNKSRILHRLKDFSSSKLAQRHGEAIGAHIIGMSETAVKKLRGVAKVAPGAPQVYSSLGLVYDSMLREIEEKFEKLDSNNVDGKNTEECVTNDAVTNASNKNANEDDSDRHDEEIIVGEIDDDNERKKEVVDPCLDLMRKRMELARKAFASYHVAAILCKRDYSLWERSGDVANKIASIYTDAMKYVEKNPMPSCSESQDEAFGNPTNDVTSKSKKFDPHSDGMEKLKSERISWIEQAQTAYESADLLRPDGAEIPCKLAQSHIMLENYLEAYTILTKLEEESKGKELMESYSCYLLYADLMVRIGYECQIWNDGSSHNRAYMFKRWLRKHSRTFDWRERRLRALSFALELAAGTKSCMKLIDWMKKRTEDFERNENDDGMGVDVDADEDADTSAAKTADAETYESEENRRYAKSTASKTTALDKSKAYEKERVELVIRNKVELNEFDKKSKEMNLVEGSHMHRNRVKVREALVEKHRYAILKLAQKMFANEPEAEKLQSPNGNTAKKPVSAQGSCATVLDIAGLIMNQCVQCGLYECGVLVVQSVLAYFRERIARHERRVTKQNEMEKSRHVNNGIAHAGFRFDKINFDVEESEDEDDNILSDDEELEDCNSTSGLLHLLKSGMLPTQLKAMFALCLLGMGGQDHVALNCLENAIHSTELESWNEGNTLTKIYSNEERMWIIFQENLIAPVNKLSLLASVADVIHNDVKNDFWIPRLLAIFRHFLRDLDKNHGVDKILNSRSEVTRKNAVKLVYAVTELIVNCAKSDLTSSIETGTDDDKVAQQVVTDIVYAFKIIARFEDVFWTPNESDWSLPNSSMKTLKLLSSALSVLVQASSLGVGDNLYKSIKNAIATFCHVISIICNADSDTLDGLFGWNSFKDENSSETWASFPLASDWQLPFHRKISLKTFNLCVASCVSSFSGWEPNEFHLDLLRSRDNGNIFGISISGLSVAGFLNSHITDEIGSQWQLVSRILQNLENIEYERSLARRMNAEWYQKVMDNLKRKGSEKNTIACFGEHDALRIMLSFSNLCLIAAEHNEGDQTNGLLKLSMSVLLPLTQFSIDKLVWDSEIGTRVINDQNESRVSYYLDENSQWMGPTKQSDNKMPPSNKKRRQQKSKNVFMRQLTPSKIVRVSTYALLEEWNKDTPVREDYNASESAILAMKKLDDSMKNLKKSRTVCSLERASLDVATALIDVAAHDECQNPFLCVQQAAIFASMAPKRGTNDEPFKKFLPVQTRCTPSEAIIILGRADCMRAVHFLDEAQFLCSWVANECSLRRDGDENELPWCSRWKAVGILTYIIASAIDETSMKLSCTDRKAGAIRQWGEAVEEEIRRGKADAIALVREYRCKEAVENYDTDDSDEINVQNPVTRRNAMPSLPQHSRTPATPSNKKTSSSENFENENPANTNTKQRTPKPVPLPTLPPYEDAIQHSEGLDVDDVEAVEVAPGQADVTAFLMEEINQHRIKSEDEESEDDFEFSHHHLQTGSINENKSSINYGDGLDGAINEALDLDNIEVLGI